MDWFKRNPLLGAVLLLLGTAVMLEGWFWARSHRESLRALAALEQKKQEREWLGRQSPALSRENEEAIARDLASTRKLLAALQSALLGAEGGDGVAPPAKAIDLYFDLAAFVEKTRALAARTSVAVKADERFGFATHANEGPEAGLVPAVFQQRLAAQYLVEALLEARPRSLLAVRRERPLTAAQRAGSNQPPPPVVSDGAAADFFEFAPALSVRVPGQVDSDAFRLEFTGQTTALRNFLNTLATFQCPVIVRSVEVEPVAAEGAGPASAEGESVPLVSQNISKFAVVVEVVLPVSVPSEKTAP